MRVVPLSDRAGLEPRRRAILEYALGSQRTLADVLAWSRAQRPPAEVAEIVTQDEYTHDVIVAHGAEAERIYLVFDTT